MLFMASNSLLCEHREWRHGTKAAFSFFFPETPPAESDTELIYILDWSLPVGTMSALLSVYNYAHTGRMV